MNNYVQILGIISGVFTSASLIPQLVKIIREKKAESVSKGMFIVMIIGFSGWIWYGIEKSDIPIIATNCFSVLTNSFILFFAIKYKKKDKK